MSSSITLDGERIRTYDDFVAEFNREYCRLFGPPLWDGQSFDDLDDFLEFARPLKIHWINSPSTRIALGYAEMMEFKSRSLDECKRNFPECECLIREIAKSIEEARSNTGHTLFEYICWQINGPDCEIILE